MRHRFGAPLDIAGGDDLPDLQAMRAPPLVWKLERIGRRSYFRLTANPAASLALGFVCHLMTP